VGAAVRDVTPGRWRLVVHQTGFWPAFLNWVGGSASAIHAFDDGPADVSAMFDELDNSEAWPVLALGLRQGHLLHIVMRNFPDDAGVDYVLSPADGGQHIPLAAMEGHFRGPALSWLELVAAARQPDALSPAARLLLLKPVAADTDTPANASAVIAAALTSVGATAFQHEVAGELAHDHRHWEPATWTTFQGLRVCTGGHSYRTLGSLTREQHELIDQALTASTERTRRGRFI
jgi:hypothetical protein